MHELTSCGSNLLHTAEHCSDAMLPRLVAAGVKLEQRNKHGLTPLLQLVSHVDDEIDPTDNKLPGLLRLGAVPRAADKGGQTVLHAVARSWYGVGLVAQVVAAGADVGCIDAEGRTTLMHAATVYNLNHIEELLELGADAAATDASGGTALHHLGTGFIEEREEFELVDQRFQLRSMTAAASCWWQRVQTRKQSIAAAATRLRRPCSNPTTWWRLRRCWRLGTGMRTLRGARCRCPLSS